jgi:hypothetical protein
VRFQGPGSPASERGAEDGAEADGGAGSPAAAAERQQALELGPDGRRVVDALFDGLAAEFHSMVRRQEPHTAACLRPCADGGAAAGMRVQACDRLAHSKPSRAFSRGCRPAITGNLSCRGCAGELGGTVAGRAHGAHAGRGAGVAVAPGRAAVRAAAGIRSPLCITESMSSMRMLCQAAMQHGCSNGLLITPDPRDCVPVDDVTRCPQVELLDDCMAKLLGHFEKGLWERVTAITRCEHRDVMADLREHGTNRLYRMHLRHNRRRQDAWAQLGSALPLFDLEACMQLMTQRFLCMLLHSLRMMLIAAAIHDL